MENLDFSLADAFLLGEVPCSLLAGDWKLVIIAYLLRGYSFRTLIIFTRISLDPTWTKGQLRAWWFWRKIVGSAFTLSLPVVLLSVEAA
jgi:hypothetical protein